MYVYLQLGIGLEECCCVQGCVNFVIALHTEATAEMHQHSDDLEADVDLPTEPHYYYIYIYIIYIHTYILRYHFYESM